MYWKESSTRKGLLSGESVCCERVRKEDIEKWIVDTRGEREREKGWEKEESGGAFAGNGYCQSWGICFFMAERGDAAVD